MDDIVSEIWEIDKGKLFIKTRKREIDEARMVAMQYRNEKMGCTLRKAAEPYGLNHATVVHAKKTIDDLVKNNMAFRQKYEQFKKAIQQIKPL